MRGFFVTGTDTGVGKTVVSAALAHHYGFRYWKPIQTGPESDTAEVRRLAGCDVLDAGVRLPEPVSPHLAARSAGVHIDLEELLAMAARGAEDGGWIVEGAGGALAPVNESQTMADLMVALGLPVIVVARTTLGTINHTLLTLALLRTCRLEAAFVVMSGESNPHNREAIEHYGHVPVIELPRLSPLTPEAVRGWTP